MTAFNYRQKGIKVLLLKSSIDNDDQETAVTYSLLLKYNIMQEFFILKDSTNPTLEMERDVLNSKFRIDVDIEKDKWFLNRKEILTTIGYPWHDVDMQAIKLYFYEGQNSELKDIYSYYYIDPSNYNVYKLEFKGLARGYESTLYDENRENIYELINSCENYYETKYNTDDILEVFSNFYNSNININSQVNADSSDYFENLNYNYPHNEDGTCSLIAIMQILSYYDYYYDSDIINDEYNVPGIIYFNLYGNHDYKSLNEKNAKTRRKNL